MASYQDTLLQRTRSAIKSYNTNRTRLIKEAFEEGGQESVTALEEEFIALNNAAFNLQRAKLKRNHRRYGALLKEAAATVSEARSLITGSASALAVLDGLGRAVTLIGRSLLILGAPPA
ncbi:MAG: hypothetical protein GX230_08790 [Lentisphaerae bacterium]|jgi:hypothetical protein|nr:hypothetical protein [Lentisphaerota bacterium]